MAEELIRLDTTIIGIDSLINKASTVEEAKALYAARSVIYSQQRCSKDAQPAKRGQWIECCNELNKKCSCCDKVHGTIYDRELFCPNCGARMDGDTE